MKRYRVWLGERVEADIRGARVDRDAGVIRGVKVLGWESKNGRRYLPEAVKAAAKLYEGKSVRTNHPRRAADQRDVLEVFGWLENVRVTDAGMYADLHILNPTTELAESVFLAAEKKPDLFGLSHNADGTTERRDGETVVSEITEVRSVDLVTDPATVGGLFEGRGRMKLKAFLESCRLPGKGKPAKRKILARLFEDEMLDPALDAPMDAPDVEAGPEDHEEALRAGFEASCHALVTKLLSGEMDEAEGMKKLKELISSHGKLSSKDAPVEETHDEDEDDLEESDEEEDEEGEEELEECEDDEEDMKESVKLRRKLKRLETREEVRELCESKGYSPSKAMLSALVAVPAADRDAIITEAKGHGSGAKKPRNQAVTEGRGGNGNGSVGNGQPISARDITSGEMFASLLRRGSN